MKNMGKTRKNKQKNNTDIQKEKGNNLRRSLEAFFKSEDPVRGTIKDILWVIVVVGVIAAGLYIFSGTWPAVVAVESESMVPNMNVGDLIFVVEENRFGELQTWEDGLATGYGKFNSMPDLQSRNVYGDVIIYKPNGDDSVHPIIHRAVEWYEGNTSSGYITKGDNNQIADQLSGISGIGQIMPVKKEWVVGKALFSVPLIGYAPLHIVEFAIILILIMVVHELYIRSDGRDKK
ncbi:S24/S26 family peptidase [Methanoplanus limicola]|uniref:Peptidase S26B, signal peptidase n=1 Tax=Methanoplanus limicola DSM 2279 TaxID=937775 RepID=H1YYK0_9EURY|nr:S26 family signal peptidase [Methanoplanus limicola]EHQ35098.1 peptidase S26B, signal peptidase [Methanoplanus limicola DSM 2279]